MALTVNTNTTSLGVQKNLNRASDALSTSMTRLSSGLKINSAKDDAAGLQIATRMTSQIRGQTMAIKNANDGISIAQTAEGAMQEQTNILQRMRELAVQARNDSNSEKDREALNKEFAQMSDELSRIAKSTQLNGKNLLDGTAGTMTFQVGSNSGADNQISITLDSGFDAQTLSVDSATIAITGTDSDTAEASFAAAVDAIDAALQTINTTRADLGAAQNRLTSTINNLQNINENAEAARGRVQDTDFAAETAQLTKQQTLQQASTSVLAQANQLPSAVLKLLQ
ncbi:flagellin domain-containing protein [Pseudomonas guariconensis]|uniref:flagellin domain-containing protein n=1 Tax=Pseudomonas TaxID=286 RepID=UPI002096D906|nr:MULTISPECIES: flagellin domain-containing protein [Pseudomonas]MCO7642450.1 flagellin domain-containing protein [Pseudomonas sp. S 311-6]MCO7516152.1 flagellin domain-containing protein [Pseudomonas putida]MCO7566754.1 flagellin domain-containing protein [Pseudomonas mosselii]MCO7606054.1 flagellin domain-containing protein [Pseudomonas guariconensis]MCO7618743.1 flagellin domain-containing protein [Pseudomonas guariconensis]